MTNSLSQFRRLLSRSRFLKWSNPVFFQARSSKKQSSSSVTHQYPVTNGTWRQPRAVLAAVGSSGRSGSSPSATNGRTSLKPTRHWEQKNSSQKFEKSSTVDEKDNWTSFNSVLMGAHFSLMWYGGDMMDRLRTKRTPSRCVQSEKSVSRNKRTFRDN